MGPYTLVDNNGYYLSLPKKIGEREYNEISMECELMT